MKKIMINQYLYVFTNIDEILIDDDTSNIEIKIYKQYNNYLENYNDFEIGEVVVDLDSKKSFIEEFKIYNEDDRSKGIGGKIFEELCKKLKSYCFNEISGCIENDDDFGSKNQRERRKKFYINHGCFFINDTEFKKTL